MNITMTRRDNTIIAAFEGRLDVNTTPEAERQLMAPAAIPNIKLILDFGKLEYISSYGLRVLLMLQKVVQKANGQLKLVAVPPMVARVLTTSGISKFFTQFPTLESALADDSQPEETPDFQ